MYMRIAIIHSPLHMINPFSGAQQHKIKERGVLKGIELLNHFLFQESVLMDLILQIKNL